MPRVDVPYALQEQYMAALWTAAASLKGASIRSGWTGQLNFDTIEVGFAIAPQTATQYVIALPLPGSRLGRPWTDPDTIDPEGWARTVLSWIQTQVDRRFPSWAAYEVDDWPYRRVYIGADGILEAPPDQG